MQKFKSVAYGITSSALLLAPLMAGAQWSPNTAGGGQAGTFNLPGGRVTDLITTAIYWLLGILGFIAIIAFVISGILYLTAAGNEEQIEKAKSTMTYAIIGLVVALLGWVVVRAVGAFVTNNFGGF